jgi:cysteinyl-tRNA synthetase
VIARQHYRSAIDLSDKLFRDNINSLLDFHRLFARIPSLSACSSDLTSPESLSLIESFEAAMDNDFNTPEALVALDKLRSQLVQQLDASKITTDDVAGRVKLILELGNILGLFFDSLEVVETQGLGVAARALGAEPLSRDQVQNLLKERLEVRAAKNFTRSDEIRAELAARGVEVLDTKQGSTYRFA